MGGAPCKAMAASQLLLSIPRIEHETPAVGRMDHKQAGWRGRLRGGRSYDLGRSSIRSRFHIGRMRLVIEGCSEDPLLAQGAAVARLPRYQNEHGIVYAAGSQLCKGKVVWAEIAASSTGWVWWIRFRAADYRLISRSLVKPRKVGDCMMNES